MENNNNENRGGKKSNTPSLDRLFKVPAGFTERIQRPRRATDHTKSIVDELTATPVQVDTPKRAESSKPRRAPTRARRNGTAKNSVNTVSPAASAPMLDIKVLEPTQLTSPQRKSKRSGRAKTNSSVLKIMPLGGLCEIGKNMTAYEYEDEIIVVDCGLAFPDNDMLGVDLVIPDFTYLARNRHKLKGLFVTHGHEDHIGAIPYFLRDLNIPVYATKLAIGLIEGKLKEHGLLESAKLKVVRPREVYNVGKISVEFIHVNHSFPDSCALAIHTPCGIIVQTGDFKIDYTPIGQDTIDLRRFGELGDEGVMALLCDSTNAENPGYTKSERVVGYSFDNLFRNASGKRIIVATFASNVYRIQQIADAAAKTKRKIVVFGRSMVNVVQKALELGYLKAKESMFIDIERMNEYQDGQLVVISTGSQGEPLSALARMSTGDHRQVKVDQNDYIIISAQPIPGNEKHVGKLINDLMRLGAEVIYEKMYETHVSGHACQDEIKTMIALTKPKYFIPVHGEYKHLVKNAQIARSMGYTSKNIVISDIGNVIECNGDTIKQNGTVPAGKVLVDGLGVGDVGSLVLRDRKLLAEEGLLMALVTADSATGEMIAGPTLVSRGFVYVKDSDELMKGASDVVSRTIMRFGKMNSYDYNSIKGKIVDNLSEYIYTRTKRKPMIIPVIQTI